MKKKILVVLASVLSAIVLLTGCGNSDFDLTQEVICGDVVLNIPSNYIVGMEVDDFWWFCSEDADKDTNVGIAVYNNVSSETTGKFERVEEFESSLEIGYEYQLIEESTEERNGEIFYIYSTNLTSPDGTLSYYKKLCISKGDTHVHIVVGGVSEAKKQTDSLFDKMYKTIEVK